MRFFKCPKVVEMRREDLVEKRCGVYQFLTFELALESGLVDHAFLSLLPTKTVGASFSFLAVGSSVEVKGIV